MSPHSHYPISSSFVGCNLLNHQQIKNSIAVNGKRYIMGIVIASGFKIPTPTNPAREIRAPVNSHFQARPSPPSIKTPDKIMALALVLNLDCVQILIQ